MDLSDFVAGFLLEAEENLHSVNQNLVASAEALKKGLPEPRATRDLFRALHTIKGLASMVGAEPIVSISHEMEGLLRTADRSGGYISEKVLDLLLQGTRAIEERVRAVAKNGIQNIPAEPKKLIESLAHALETEITPKRETAFEFSLPKEILASLSAADHEQIIQAGNAGKRVVLLEFQPSPERAASGLNITSVREALSEIGVLIKVVPRSVPTAPTGIAFSLLLETESSDQVLSEKTGGSSIQQVSAVAKPVIPMPGENLFENEQNEEWLPTEQSSIRVDVRRLDEALEQLSGLFVTRFKLERAVADLMQKNVDTRELKAVLGENSRQLKRLRTAISAARMVPLTELLQRLPLVVRGITRDSDKTVNLTIHAGSAEVDKAVADKIFPAVVHLVRNAVDHAIESRQDRRQASKPEVGEISIVCDDSSGTNLVLTIADDGRGINRESVARKAGQPMASTDEELLQQICTAGLSTSEVITHTSGRGMGMEIVKRTVEILGGSLELKTVEGKGTAITLRVPVTVTIVDVFSFISGDQVFVSPVSIVDEIIELEPGSSVVLPSPDQKGPQARLIQHRGKAVPLFILDSVLHDDGKVPAQMPAKALIVNRNRGAIAFGIDRMIGKQEAVVRPLDDSLVRVTGMAGATDLGDGRPTLVLDLVMLGSSILKNNLQVRSLQ